MRCVPTGVAQVPSRQPSEDSDGGRLGLHDGSGTVGLLRRRCLSCWPLVHGAKH